MLDRVFVGGAARLLRTLCVAGAVVAAVASCRDGAPADLSAPGADLAPGHASLAIAPRFATLPTGAPSITLASVKGLLISTAGDTIVVTAHFQGDSAVLDFNVQFTGSSATYKLDLTAFDANGVIAYHAAQDVTLRPGKNNSVNPVLVYAAPDAAVTALHVSPSVVTLNAGASGAVSVTGTNASGQAVVPVRVGWTSRGAAVTVDDNGNLVAGQFQGTTWVVARTANNVADSAQVKVHAPVAKVVAAPTTVQVLRGASAAAAAELRDAGNNLIDDRTATWSSADPTIATVNSTGVITGVKIGTTTITAALEGKSATVAVTVVTPLDHIEVTPTTLTFASLHETKTLTVKLVPKAASPSSSGVTGGAAADVSLAGIVPVFTVDDPTIALVDQTGVVTALKNGTVTVTVTADGLTATTPGTVKQVAATVTVTPKTASVSAVGDAVRFTATALDALGSVIDGAVFTWTSSDPSVGTVSSSGVLTAKKAGAVSVTAALDGKTDTGNLNVAPTIRLLGLYLSKNSIAVGGGATVVGKFADANGNPLSDAPTTFTTTTPGIISVSSSGSITGLAAGTGHIFGTSGSFTGSVDITVTGSGGGGGGTLVLNLTTAEKLPRSTENLFVVSGGTGPYTWTVNGIPDGNSTYGTISYGETSPAGVSITYHAPASVPTPSVFDVCAVQDTPPNTGCVHVTISAIPSGGADVIVFNDINMFDNSYGSPYAGNVQLFKNLVNFTTTGPRAGQTGVMFYRGHSSRCGGPSDPECTEGAFSGMYGTITGLGYSITDIDDLSNTITASIPSSIRTLFLLMPETSFSDAEINYLKEFAGQGGRIVYVGEREPYLLSTGIAVENNFFISMGALMRNTGGDYACPDMIDAAHIQPHEVTAGVTSLSMACVSSVTLGTDDYALFFDRFTAGIVLGAVAKVDLTPIIDSRAPPPLRLSAAKAGARPSPTRIPVPVVARDTAEHSWGRGPRPGTQKRP